MNFYASRDSSNRMPPRRALTAEQKAARNAAARARRQAMSAEAKAAYYAGIYDRKMSRARDSTDAGGRMLSAYDAHPYKSAATRASAIARDMNSASRRIVRNPKMWRPRTNDLLGFDDGTHALEGQFRPYAARARRAATPAQLDALARGRALRAMQLAERAPRVGMKRGRSGLPPPAVKFQRY